MAGELPALTHLPGGTYALALALGTRRLIAREWAGTPMHRWTLVSPRPEGLSAAPHDPRPADALAGRKILAGRFELGGAVLDTGSRGDPWDRPSPSRRFALALHRLDWLRDLLAVGPDANAEGLRLVLDWSRVFGRWNSFSWNPQVLSRRVFNLACAAPTVIAGASDAERALIVFDLARQARHLLATIDGPESAAERACAAALAGAALSGKAGTRLIDRGLRRLVKALPVTAPPDGGHASRNPRATLELLLDLQTLDEALVQRGLAPPEEMLRAIDRLTGAVRFFILADGALPDMQGGEAGRRSYVAASRAGETAVAPPPAGRNGYQRLEARALQVIADAAPPAEGAWSQDACAQPLSIEVLARGRRLIVNCGPAPETGELEVLRLSDAASTLTVGEATCGAPLRGVRAAALGPRLEHAHAAVDCRRNEAEGGLWLEMSHDGWGRKFHLRHERRLFLALGADELRGEDRLTPMGDSAAAAADRRFIPFLIRFHLHPEVSASLARDGRSVLLRAEGDEGWRLRTDAREVTVEASIHMVDGVAKRTHQVVFHGQCRADAGAKVRWKLEPAEAVSAAVAVETP